MRSGLNPWQTEIERAIKAGLKRFPAHAKPVDWEWNESIDHGGRNAVFVRIVLPPAKSRPVTQLSRLAGIVQEEFVRRRLDAWPYVDFFEE